MHPEFGPTQITRRPGIAEVVKILFWRGWPDATVAGYFIASTTAVAPRVSHTMSECSAMKLMPMSR
jgi:hypothetical protein